MTTTQPETQQKGLVIENLDVLQELTSEEATTLDGSRSSVISANSIFAEKLTAKKLTAKKLTIEHFPMPRPFPRPPIDCFPIPRPRPIPCYPTKPWSTGEGVIIFPGCPVIL